METATIDFRHYDIAVRACGTSKSVRSLLSTSVPNLGDLDDIADFVLRDAAGYESEGEDASTRVVLTQEMRGAGNKEQSQVCHFRLTDLYTTTYART